MSTITEILNLGTICRCCHTDGSFSDMRIPFIYKKDYEIYSDMLQQTLNIEITLPLIDASYLICRECIVRLRDASQFKKQILLCEAKFAEYCKNELTTDNHNNGNLKTHLLVGDIHTAESTVTEQTIELEIQCIKDQIKEECDDDDSYIYTSIKNEPRKKESGKKSKLKKKPLSSEFDMSLVVEVETESATVYSCKTCGGSYSTFKLMKRHIVNNHSKGEHTCTECDKRFKNSATWRSHRRSHSLYLCRLCPREFKTLSGLKDHVNFHTKAVKYRCDYCSKEFLYKSSLRVHIRGHLGTKKKCMCDLCGHSFNDVTNLVIHIRAVHEKQRPFSCQLCSKTFSAKKHLIVHIRKHTGDRPFGCAKCSRSFYTKWESNNHRCGDLERVYKCKVCSKEFSGRGTFAKHVRRSHTGEKPYRCQECGKDFTCRYSMKRHELTHSGMKPFSCNYCSMKFSQKTMVDRHVSRIHDPKKPLRLLNKGTQEQCQICKRVVVDLPKHNSQCHGDVRFVCEICHKSYAQNSALNRHRRVVHLGMHFKCVYCDKKYQQKNKLIKHQFKAHNVTVKTETDFEESVTSYKIG